MNSLVKINNEKCEICYACVRACPVKAIVVEPNKEYPLIIDDRCIGCGDCFEVCSPKAIDYRDAKAVTRSIFSSNSKVVAIVDPSISGEFDDITDYRKFVEMIRVLGFDYVNEVSFGVDLVAKRYREVVDENKGKFFITANCPAIVNYVEKYSPELLDNLVPVVTPMVATAKVVRKKYGDNIKVVYIGPCIIHKEDALRFKDDACIDAVLTFVELRELFEEANIDEMTVHNSEFDEPIGYHGSLFPISQAFKEIVGFEGGLLTTDVLTADGGDKALKAVKTFRKSINKIQHHFNIYYCKGCLMGPGTSPEGDAIYRRSMVTTYARKRLRDFDKELWEKNLKEYSDLDLSRSFIGNDQRLLKPEGESVAEVLKLIRKGDSDTNVGCGACGYDSCYDFASAVSLGMAKTDMCIQFSLNNKKEYIKTLKKTNEKLSVTQEALKQSEQLAREEQQKSEESLETTSAVLQELSAGVIVVDKKLKIVQSNKRFVTLIGEDAAEINEIIPGLVGADLKSLLPYQVFNLFSFVLESDIPIHNRDVYFNDSLYNVSIFTIKKNRVVGGVIRDLSEPEVRKEEVINRVTEAIDKNFELVQKIGFLLGEGAAESERVLNSVIKSYKSDKKKK